MSVNPDPVTPVATDNLGIHYEGPVTAAIAGAKFPPPPDPPEDDPGSRRFPLSTECVGW